MLFTHFNTRDFDDILNSFKNDYISKEYNIETEDNGYKLTINLPGYKKPEVKVECRDGYLYVTAENKSRGKKEQSFRLARGLDISSLEAVLEDGLLTITVKNSTKDHKTVEVK